MTSKNTTQNIKDVSSEALDWAVIQKDMKNKLGSDIYESWLRKIDFVEEMNSYVLLSVSTRFTRDWITSRYLDQILQIVKTYKKDIAIHLFNKVYLSKPAFIYITAKFVFHILLNYRQSRASEDMLFKFGVVLLLVIKICRNKVS